MHELAEPILEAPGAGLPASELFVARRLFAWKRRFGSRRRHRETFLKERARIRELVDSCPRDLRATRVLVPRLRGLEDSSRHWSVWMVLDHLRITNEAFAEVIAALAAGRIPPGRASTAAVKPSPEAGAETEAAYEASAGRFLDTVAGLPELRTGLRYEHPWFGPLDAAGWHALAALHLGIHRSQIAEIRRRLSGGEP